MLTSTAWPSTPPPAPPDLLVRPVHDDVGPVGTLRAFPTALATDVVMDFISQTKPRDFVQVIPLSAVRWSEVEKIVLPPQPRVTAYQPLDMRSSRWELYQCIREMPLMAGGRVVHTLIVPWHLSIERQKCALRSLPQRTCIGCSQRPPLTIGWYINSYYLNPARRTWKTWKGGEYMTEEE